MKTNFKITDKYFDEETDSYIVMIETTNWQNNVSDSIFVDAKTKQANRAQVSELFPKTRMSDDELLEAINIAEESVQYEKI